MKTIQPAEKKTGAVLVVGAGIGGIQASLDLADSGFKVYLLDRDPAIGGRMAQLDKTFPTNDCAMCTISPKLVECGRHLNIEVLTYAELESLAGEPGNFTARVRQKPRYVVEEECTACNDCAKVCPVARPDRFNMGLSERRAAYKLYAQAIPNAYVIEKRGTAPCRDACPAGQRAQGYIALIREGRYEDALRVIKEDNPFPGICGRICNHRCEEACNRGEFDEALNIRALKRFVADKIYAQPRVPPQPAQRKYEERVAVIGAGPAGLTAAQDLCKQGYDVTVFEALPVAGGMLRVGVPEYRLPAAIVEREVQDIVDLGVKLQLNTRVDNLDRLFEDGFRAVLIAVGAHEGVRPAIPGANLDGVLVNTTFLRDVRLGKAPPLGKRVAVIGAGDVAMDVARTAVRMGSDVHLYYRRTPEEASAAEEEMRHAQEEGVVFHWQVAPVEVLGNGSGRVQGVRLIRTEQGPPDETGRRRPVLVAGSEYSEPCDNVIFSVGQRAGLAFMPKEVKTEAGVDPSEQATISVNADLQVRPGVFAAGDVTTGTAFVIEAVAAGHRAAQSIHRYLRGEQPEPLPERRAEQMPVVDLNRAEVEQLVAAASPTGRAEAQARVPMRELNAQERSSTFEEVATGYSDEEARAEAARCLSCGICSECLECVYACQKHCIDHDMREEIRELQVGAVVLAPGVEAMPGDIRPELGYGRWANVVTSIEFERMLSASGPWGGVVQRPSDGKHPQKIAFIQCVGSRDVSLNQGYCSSVCCMYATKEAVIAKEHDHHTEPTIFYIDLRAFGKGFERYVARAEQEYGVRYVRSMVSQVAEVPQTRDLRLRYFSPDGNQVEEQFDLVVLSVGLRPSQGTQQLAEKLGLALNEYGFAESPPYHPGETSREDGSIAEGIFVAGAFSEPKDIPDTVIEASCAAAQASALLAGARGALTREHTWPEERDVNNEAPRVGVFVCHCGINIGSVVDVPKVIEYAAQLPYVAYAEQNTYTCSQDTQRHLRERIEEHHLNRVVVASCTPRTHEPLFQETIRGAGLNPGLFQMANIREQDSWVHSNDPQAATGKAKELVAMAVARARQQCAIAHVTSEVNHRALVVGGGVAGMTAALSIAQQGFDVTLVERQKELGGNLRHIFVSLAGRHRQVDPQRLLQDTVAAVSAQPRISVLTGTEIVDVGGYVGQYCTRVKPADGREQEIQHGVIVVATGAQQTEPKEYLYGQDSRVITQRELEALLVSPQSNLHSLQSVVMIQCVGSRDAEHPYCSRVCCTEAIKNALAIKERSPETEVYVLYRDIRTFGFKERYYREARQKGVIFLRYDKERKPEVRLSGPQDESHLEVAVWDAMLGEEVVLRPDRVVLSAGIESNATAVQGDQDRSLAQLLRVPLNEDNFFLEAHIKLRPLDFAADGVFLCGLAHSPRFLDETIAQAEGAAMRAVALLAKNELESVPIVATVDPLLCTGCGLCVQVCPYSAREVDAKTHIAKVIEVLCQGCGACIAACPNKASQQKGFEMVQVYDMIDALSLSTAG